MFYGVGIRQDKSRKIRRIWYSSLCLLQDLIRRGGGVIFLIGFVTIVRDFFVG